MARSPQISVVVCSYNRAELLSMALQTLCDQTLEPATYEVIVVDNNSVDNTRAVVEGFARRHFNIHYYLEPEQGLSHARNRGWKEARGEYVAYIDDDCKVPEEWLAVAKDIIVRVSPSVFGGPFYAFYNTPKPRWYKDSYGSHEPGKQARVLDRPECINIYGGNAFFLRTVLEATGGFDCKLGMTGGKLAYGEETALIRMIASRIPEHVIYYDPRLYVYHLVQPQKMTIRRTIQASFIRGGYSHRVFQSHAPLKVGRRRILKEAVRTSIAMSIDLARSLFRRDRVRYPYIQHYWYENTLRHVRKLGMLYEEYRQVSKALRVVHGEQRSV